MEVYGQGHRECVQVGIYYTVRNKKGKRWSTKGPEGNCNLFINRDTIVKSCGMGYL